METTKTWIDAIETEEYAEAFFYQHCLTSDSSLSLLLEKREPQGDSDNYLLDFMKVMKISREKIFQKNNNHSTPLHYVCKNVPAPSVWEENSKSANVAKLLIKEGADINAKDVYGWTPFHYAALKTLDRSFLREVFVESPPVNELSPWKPYEFAHLEEQEGNFRPCYKGRYASFVQKYQEKRLDPDFLVPGFSNPLIKSAVLSDDPAYNKEDLEGMIKKLEDNLKKIEDNLKKAGSTAIVRRL